MRRLVRIASCSLVSPYLRKSITTFLLLAVSFVELPAAERIAIGPHFSTDPKDLYLAASQGHAPEGTDVSVIQDEESYVFDAAGRSAHTVYVVFRVLTQKGAEKWGPVSMSWEPWHEERPVIRARVITADFAVHELDQKTLSDAPASQDDPNIFSDRRVVRAPLPAVAPGSVVEEEFLVRENAPFFDAGTVQRAYFGRVGFPVQHTRLSLEAPSSTPLQYVVQLLPEVKTKRSEADGRLTVEFDHDAMEPLDQAEINLPSDAPAYPMITFSTGQSWRNVAESYSETVDSNIAGNLKPLVQKLIQGKRSRTEKAQALLEFLDKEVRYTGVEFREASIVPHSPSYTLSHKYGDCKDKAALLVALLRAADVPAYIALLRAGGRMDVPDELPGMGLFDHAIVYAPGDPDLWIDATDEYARIGSLPGADQGRLALIARAGTEKLVRTPESSSQDNVLLERREFYLAENGPARVVETSEPKGVFESEYRRSYADKQNKDNHENLTNYVKSQYLAEKLDRLDRSDPSDFSKPFELTLETDKASRGMTDLVIAVAAIRLEGLFYHLPEELRTRENSDDRGAGEPRRKAWRTRDYQLPEPFAAVWEYKVVLPPGYQAKPLPSDVTQPLGPALLTEHFFHDSDGSIHASLRFDTVKRKFTVAEATEMRNKIADVSASRAIVLSFEPVGEALLKQGKVRESLNSYRNLVAQHPKDAVHHLQIANTLLRYGFGGPARDEARLATRLEPASALAYQTLAEILEFDVVGRKLRRGSDYPGAAAAFREAEKLKPEDKSIVGNLAILLEYNEWGARYGTGANLKEAVAEYRKLSPQELSTLGLQNNVPYALFYSGEFEEARKSAASLNPPLKALIVACESALHGSQAGIAEANRVSENDEQFKQTVKIAGELLRNKRRYSEAADLLEAGASGDDAASTMELAATLRKTQPHESIVFGADPAGVGMNFVALANELPLNTDRLGVLASRNGRTFLLSAEQLEKREKLNRGFFTNEARLEAPADVDLDIFLLQAQPRVEGNDSSGYKIALWAGSSRSTHEYVVKEDGTYKVLGGLGQDEGVALEILDRLAANNLTGARTLLDWLWEDWHSVSSNDPLAGDVFARFWTRAKDGDAQLMKLAAAAVLVEFESTAKRGVEILEDARKTVLDDNQRTSIDVALCVGYENLEDYENLLRVSSPLAKRFPESAKVFAHQAFALRRLSRFDAADALAQERLQRLPDDQYALWMRVAIAVDRADQRSAYERSQEYVKTGKATPPDLNTMAWLTLFFDHPGGPDIETALKSIQLKPDDSHTLHTLGCLYAEAGKLKEAREVLIQAMDLDRLNEPDSDFWYAFGRIAEQSGEIDIARDYYAKVTEPKVAWRLPDSTHRLAQLRLKAISGISK